MGIDDHLNEPQRDSGQFERLRGRLKVKSADKKHKPPFLPDHQLRGRLKVEGDDGWSWVAGVIGSWDLWELEGL